jgi:hypothetical protein
MSALAWYIPFPLLSLLLWLLVKRGAHRTFPWFLSYVAFAVAAGTARFLARSHPALYFWVYWLTDAGHALLGASAIYEILREVLRDSARAWWTHLIFPSVVAIGVGLSLEHAHAFPPQVHGRLLLWVVTGEIAVRIVQVVIFAGLVTFCWIFPIPLAPISSWYSGGVWPLLHGRPADHRQRDSFFGGA